MHTAIKCMYHAGSLLIPPLFLLNSIYSPLPMLYTMHNYFTCHCIFNVVLYVSPPSPFSPSCGVVHVPPISLIPIMWCCTCPPISLIPIMWCCTCPPHLPYPHHVVLYVSPPSPLSPSPISYFRQTQTAGADLTAGGSDGLVPLWGLSEGPFP